MRKNTIERSVIIPLFMISMILGLTSCFEVFTGDPYTPPVDTNHPLTNTILPVKSGFTIVNSNGNTGVNTSLFAKGQNIFISYQDDNNNGSLNYFKVASSTNGGIDWYITNLQLLTPSTVPSSIQSDGTNIYLAYRHGFLDFRHSPDRGRTWDILSSIANNNAQGTYPTLRMGNGKLHAIYCNTQTYDLMYARSTNGGQTWPSTDKKNVVTDTAGYYNSMAVNGDILYASYMGYQNHVTFIKSLDGGGSWDATTKRLLEKGYYTSIGYNSSTIIIAYCTSVSNSINVARSLDYGNSWTSSLLDRTSDNSGMGYTSLAVNGNNWYITYCELKNHDLKLAKSTDNGVNWTISTIDSTNWVGEFNSLAVDGSRLFVSYYDRSNGDLILAVSEDGGDTWQ